MSKSEAIEFQVRIGFSDVFVPVHDARRLVIEGYEQFEFATHRPLNRSTGFVVSEKESGCRLSLVKRTRKQAEASARRTLDAWSSTNDLRRRIRMACKGKDPRKPGQGCL